METIPAAISAGDGSVIKTACQKLVTSDINTYYPKVFVTYATGNRINDAEGCGPGMYHAHWLVKQIADVGMDSFSGLHVPPGMNWKMFLEKLGGPFSEARFLLVVLTPALFTSKICLAEINTAMKAHVTVIPILFESVAKVTSAEQWTPLITKNSPFEEKNWLREAKPWFCNKNSQPSPGSDAYQSQALIRDMLRDTVLSVLDNAKATESTSNANHGQTVGAKGDARLICHLAAVFEPPSGPKHTWFDDINGYQRRMATVIQTTQEKQPAFNPVITLRSADDASAFLGASADSQTSCVLWRATAPPLAKPGAKPTDQFDDEALDIRFALPVLSSMVAQQGAPLDLMVVVMNRGAEYTAKLALSDMIAHNVVWVALASQPRKMELRVVNQAIDMVMAVFERSSKVDAAAIRDLFRSKMFDQLPDVIKMGIEQTKAAYALERLPFPVGKINIVDNVTDESLRKLDEFKQAGQDNASEFDPGNTVDVSHFHSAEALYVRMNRALKNASQPEVIGVMADWEGIGGSTLSNIESTSAVIQHAGLKMCTAPGAVANAIVRQDIRIPDVSDITAIKAALAECVNRATTAGKFELPGWASRVKANGSSVIPLLHPIVIWVQPRNTDGDLIELPIAAVKQMLKSTSQAKPGVGGGRRRKKKDTLSQAKTGDFTEARWVFVVPIQHGDADDVAPTSTFSAHSIRAAPTNIQLDEACGDLLRVDNVPQEWLDKFGEATLAKIVMSAVRDTAKKDLHHTQTQYTGDWIDRVFRDTATSFVVRVKVTDIVFMHVLRSCMFRPGLIVRLRSRLIARWRWRRQLDVSKGMSGVVQMALAAKLAAKNREVVDNIVLDKQLFSQQYMAVLQQLDKLTTHQRHKAAECFGNNHRVVHIKGPAGSGKTFVALHVALKALEDEPPAGHKQRVIFVAPNPAMCLFFGRWLLQRFEKLFEDAAELLSDEYEIDVAHFNKGADGSSAQPAHILQRLEFQEGAVKLGKHPTDTIDAPYNLAIVDEAHHIFHRGAIASASLELLHKTMQDCVGTSGVDMPSVVLCSDLAQFGALTGDMIAFPVANAEVTLLEVVRNSSRIVVASQAFSKTANLKLSSYTQIEGPPLRPYVMPSTDASKKFPNYAEFVIKSLVDLNNEFGSMPLHRCSAILVPNAAFRDALKDELGKTFSFEAEHGTVSIELVSAVSGADSGASVTEPVPGAPQQVVLDTIESFDGMERLVILAVGLDTPRSDQGTVMQSCSMIYRAMTRAHLFVAVVQQHVPGGWLEFLTAVTHATAPAADAILAASDNGATDDAPSTAPSATASQAPGTASGSTAVLVDADLETAMIEHAKQQDESVQIQISAITRVAEDAAKQAPSQAAAAQMIIPGQIETSLWSSNLSGVVDDIEVQADFFNPYETGTMTTISKKYLQADPTDSDSSKGNTGLYWSCKALATGVSITQLTFVIANSGSNSHFDLYRYAHPGTPAKSDCEERRKWEKLGDYDGNPKLNEVVTIKFNRKIKAAKGVDVWLYLCSTTVLDMRWGDKQKTHTSKTDGTFQISTGTPSRRVFSFGDDIYFLAGGLYYEIETTVSRTGGILETGWDPEFRGKGIVCHGNTVKISGAKESWVRTAGHVAPGTVGKWQLHFGEESGGSVYIAGVVGDTFPDIKTIVSYTAYEKRGFWGAQNDMSHADGQLRVASGKGQAWFAGCTVVMTLDRTGPTGTLSWDATWPDGKVHNHTISGITGTGNVFPAVCVLKEQQSIELTALEGLFGEHTAQEVPQNRKQETFDESLCARELNFSNSMMTVARPGSHGCYPAAIVPVANGRITFRVKITGSMSTGNSFSFGVCRGTFRYDSSDGFSREPLSAGLIQNCSDNASIVEWGSRLGGKVSKPADKISLKVGDTVAVDLVNSIATFSINNVQMLVCDAPGITCVGMTLNTDAVVTIEEAYGGAGGPTVKPCTVPQTGAKLMMVGSKIEFTQSNKSADWSGLEEAGLSSLSFHPGGKYEVAQIKGRFFRPTAYSTLWAPISATDHPRAA